VKQRGDDFPQSFEVDRFRETTIATGAESVAMHVWTIKSGNNHNRHVVQNRMRAH